MSRVRQPVLPEDLDEHDLQRANLRMAHLLETETGFRSGSRFWALPGEPRARFDPDRTTLTARRAAKVEELKGLSAQDAGMLGLGHVSVRTLERMAAAWRERGLMGLVDGRWVPVLRGHVSVTEQVAEAINAVHAESLHRSKTTMRTKERLICQYMAERFGAEVPVPHYNTLLRVWKEWFGPGGERQRYARSAAAAAGFVGDRTRVPITRPGQVVVLDTTPLPVKVLDDVFGSPISADLTLALDAYTHSLVAFRLTPGSDSSIEVAMLLRDMLCPLPMRSGWGADMAWPYPGVPAVLVAEFAGHPVAGRPFFCPETLTSDHGSVYKNHHLVQVARRLGIDLLPARMMRPGDKAACERAFGGIRTLLLESLLGYSGVDVADRGADPEADAVWTLEQMEELLAVWTVKVWQNRRLQQYAPAWDPGGRHSPNTLFAASAARDGIVLQIPGPELYYELLPTTLVRIDPRRGVKVGGLFYDVPAELPDVLAPYRGRLSARGGRHRGRWAISRDPRDCRQVFFCDPADGAWHALRWSGLPSGQDVPAFSDARVGKALREATAAGLRPRDDRELLPVLLDLLAARTPVDAWPTQMTAKQRNERARELARARQAAADRPKTGGPCAARVPVMTPAELAGAHQRAVDAERRQRRQAAVGDRVAAAPPLLSEALRRGNRFVLAEPGAADDQVAGNEIEETS